ncbi:MAG: hypothetical protein Q7J80_12885, partial [Anaerolineales bacterium]|nr:hypothetical protein [Anaerolineales bacterium]
MTKTSCVALQFRKCTKPLCVDLKACPDGSSLAHRVEVGNGAGRRTWRHPAYRVPHACLTCVT